MNFTREPIIETIITPREGYRLIVRSTKREEGEEFAVDAIEVVSFGQALFFRNLEKPKPFLLPITDYQVVEGKEARVVPKNAPVDRTIKIGGGKEASPKREIEEESEEEIPSVAIEPAAPDAALERRRERRRNRRYRERDTREGGAQATEPAREGGETPALPPVMPQLIPPPPTLISASIQKYKLQQSQSHPSEPAQKEGEGEANVISRSTTDNSPASSDWGSFLT